MIVIRAQGKWFNFVLNLLLTLILLFVLLIAVIYTMALDKGVGLPQEVKLNGIHILLSLFFLLLFGRRAWVAYKYVTPLESVQIGLFKIGLVFNNERSICYEGWDRVVALNLITNSLRFNDGRQIFVSSGNFDASLSEFETLIKHATSKLPLLSRQVHWYTKTRLSCFERLILVAACLLWIAAIVLLYSDFSAESFRNRLYGIVLGLLSIAFVFVGILRPVKYAWLCFATYYLPGLFASDKQVENGEE